MKSLVETIRKARVIESYMSQTYRKAAEKAIKLGDNRYKKFIDAYKNELEKEVDLDKTKSVDYKHYKEDKEIFYKLNKYLVTKYEEVYNIDGFNINLIGVVKLNNDIKYKVLPREYTDGIKAYFNNKDYSTTNKNARYVCGCMSANKEVSQELKITGIPIVYFVYEINSDSLTFFAPNILGINNNDINKTPEWSKIGFSKFINIINPVSKYTNKDNIHIIEKTE